MTDDRHYALVAEADLVKLPPDAVVGEQLDDGRRVVKLRGVDVKWGAYASAMPRGVALVRAEVRQRRTVKDAAEAVESRRP